METIQDREVWHQYGRGCQTLDEAYAKKAASDAHRAQWIASGDRHAACCNRDSIDAIEHDHADALTTSAGPASVEAQPSAALPDMSPAARHDRCCTTPGEAAQHDRGVEIDGLVARECAGLRGEMVRQGRSSADVGRAVAAYAGDLRRHLDATAADAEIEAAGRRVRALRTADDLDSLIPAEEIGRRPALDSVTDPAAFTRAPTGHTGTDGGEITECICSAGNAPCVWCTSGASVAA